MVTKKATKNPSTLRRIRPLLLIPIVTLLFLALGYTRATSAHFCPQCAKHEYRLWHQFSVPFGGRVLFEFNGGLRPAWMRQDPLTPFLDPNGSCQHAWVGFGWDGIGLTHGRSLGIGLDPASNIVASEPDFSEFLDENPGVLHRIRTDLSQRRTLRGWLADEYFQWKEQ